MAPAGYGKTTLLADFVDDCRSASTHLAICWQSIGAWDGDEAVFLGNVIRALAKRYPAVGQRALPLLEQDPAGAGAGPARAMSGFIAAATRLFLEDATTHIHDDTLLVLDDYHLLGAKSSAHKLLQTLLERLNPVIHVVLASRTVPLVDTSHLLLAGQVSTVDATDLALTRDELRELLITRYAVSLDENQLAQVHTWSEGWIAGVVLAAPTREEAERAGRSVAAVLTQVTSAGPSADRLREYLVDQMLKRLPEAEQELLLAASLPEYVDPEQLDAVLGRDNTGETLARLAREGLLMSRMAVDAPATLTASTSARPGASFGTSRTPSEMHRMHALLQKALRERSERGDGRKHRELQTHWGRVAEVAGDYDGAIAHFLAGRAFVQAARVVERVGEEHVDLGRTLLVERWFSQLPAELVARHPRLILCLARMDAIQGLREHAIERSRQARRSAERYRDTVTAARATLLEATTLVHAGRLEEGTQLCLTALASKTVQRRKILLAEAYRYIGGARAQQGRPEDSIEHMQKALALYEQAERPWDIALVSHNLGVVYTRSGRPDLAMPCHTRALDIHRAYGDETGTSRALLSLGLHAFYRGDLPEADALFQEVLASARNGDRPQSIAAALVNLGDLRRTQQKTVEALACYEEARLNADRASDPRWRAYAWLGIAASRLAEGDLPRAAQAAQAGFDETIPRGILDVGCHAQGCLAAVAMSDGRRREAARSSRAPERRVGSRARANLEYAHSCGADS